MVRDIGTPSPNSEARPIEMGHLYCGEIISGGYSDAVGQSIGTPETRSWYANYRIWEGRWLNGTRVRVKLTGEPGHIREFIPEGVHHVYGCYGNQQGDKVKHDTYIVMLDKHNNSYVFMKSYHYGVDEIEPIPEGDNDYEFVFDHKRAKHEFDVIAKDMA